MTPDAAASAFLGGATKSTASATVMKKVSAQLVFKGWKDDNCHWAIGVVVRYHAFLTDITRIPVYLFVGPRVTFRFGG